MLEGQVGGAVALVVEEVLAGLAHLARGGEAVGGIALQGPTQDGQHVVRDGGVPGAGGGDLGGHHPLQHLPRGPTPKELLPRQHLEEHRAQAEEIAPVVGPELEHHLRGHVGRLSGQAAVPRAAAGGDAEIDQLHRPLARHHDVAGADVAVDDGRLLEHILQGPADAADDKDREIDVGEAAKLGVALQVVHERPAVDVLQDDAELAPHLLEIEDAADVFVVEDGVAAGLVHEQAQVGGVVVLELLDDDGAQKPGLADEHAFADRAHPSRAELVKDPVLQRLGHVFSPLRN